MKALPLVMWSRAVGKSSLPSVRTDWKTVRSLLPKVSYSTLRTSQPS
jgi:hypothetical protein